MDIIKTLKKFEGKTIKTATLSLIDGMGETLGLLFTDGTAVGISGEMKDVNEIEINWHD